MIISVRTPEDELFNYKEIEELYNQCQELLDDDKDFYKVVKRTKFFAYYDWLTRELIGCIYFYHNDDKLFLNAFAHRGHHELNLDCLRESLNYFDCDIYARGLHKTSRLCLLRCGFERVKDNLFIYRRNK